MQFWIAALFGVAILADPAAAQDFTPPPHVEYEPPLRSEVSQRHNCPSGPVVLEVEGEWRLTAPGRVTVRAYSGAAGVASQSDLDRWNNWLSELNALGTIEVLCQSSGNERITIRGRDRSGLSGSITVWWWRGRLGRSF